MASHTIYAPTVNSYEPAFNYRKNENDKGVCRVYFVLSDYNIRSDVEYVHASVVKASTNHNVVDTTRDYLTSEDIFTNAGIILNLGITEVNGKQGLYYTEISGDYIYDNIAGWNMGSIYKIQLRLTKEKCPGGNATEQIAWLNTNAEKFSEWSTTITTKAIGDDYVDIPILSKLPLTSSSLDIIGTYANTDETEKMYSARITLCDNANTVLEDSGILYKDSFDTTSRFSYSFKTNLDKAIYKIKVTITTQNKHTYVKDYTIEADPQESEFLGDIYLSTIPLMRGYEEDEGCIILQVRSNNAADTYQGTLRIRRASDKDGFFKWEDIHEIQCQESTKITDIDDFTDLTVESGVYYKYGLQEITKDSEGRIIRSKLKVMDEVQRVFEYSFLLGAGGRQLKLKYDNTINNFQKTYSDVITPTIGGKYPFVTRVGSADYYSFQINGKISFSMDENNLFIDKDFLHGYTKNTAISQYDYTYEREFRNQVYAFLTDAKPKLFKSPTEGNILVRISNVSLSPEAGLSRLIYNFSATATEIDEASLEKYKKYEFIPDLNTSLLG